MRTKLLVTPPPLLCRGGSQALQRDQGEHLPGHEYFVGCVLGGGQASKMAAPQNLPNYFAGLIALRERQTLHLEEPHRRAKPMGRPS